MIAYCNNDRIKPNLAFTLYFTVMFCLYTYTYIQLAIQLFIVVYVAFPVLKLRALSVTRLHNMRFYLMWFGLFTCLLFISKYWAYDVYSGSKTMLTVFRIFVIGCMIFYSANSKKRALSILQSFIIGCAVMGMVALITTGGAIGTESFGEIIGQHRNQIGAVAAPLTVVCFFLKRSFGMRYGNVLAAYFLILTICTGSRSSVLQVVIMIVLFILFAEVNVSKKIKNMAALLLAGIICIILLQSIPFLDEVIWSRIENALKTILGIEVADTSALGRSYYKTIAYMMFLNRPLLGWGLDGFVCFVRDNGYIMSSTARLNAVYSHCNYAELAADFGIIGLLVWYIPILGKIKEVIKCRKENMWSGCLFCVFISMVLFDYSRIPWETHLVMYLFFIILILICFEKRDHNI